MTSAQASVGANNPKCVAAGVYSCDWPSKDRYGRQCLRNRPCDYKKDVVEVKGTCQWVQGKPECSEKCYKNLTGACQAIGGAGRDQPEGKPPEIPQLKPPEKAGSGDSGGSESPPSQEQRLRDVNERLGELMNEEQSDPVEVGALQKEREDLLNRLANSPETAPAGSVSAKGSIFDRLFGGWFGGSEKNLDPISGNPTEAGYDDPFSAPDGTFRPYAGDNTFGPPADTAALPIDENMSQFEPAPEQPSKGFWDTYVQPAADNARDLWGRATDAAYAARDAAYDAYTAAQETVQKTVADLWGVGPESSGPPTGVDENMTDFGPVADYRAVYDTMPSDSLRQELDRVQSDLSAGFSGGFSREDINDLLGQEQAIQDVMANRAASPIDENMAEGFSPPEQLPDAQRVAQETVRRWTGLVPDGQGGYRLAPGTNFSEFNKNPPRSAADEIHGLDGSAQVKGTYYQNGSGLTGSGDKFDNVTAAGNGYPIGTGVRADFLDKNGNVVFSKSLAIKEWGDLAPGTAIDINTQTLREAQSASGVQFLRDGVYNVRVTPEAVFQGSVSGDGWYADRAAAQAATEYANLRNSGYSPSEALQQVTKGTAIYQSPIVFDSQPAPIAVASADRGPSVQSPVNYGPEPVDAFGSVSQQPTFLQQYAPWAQPYADTASQVFDKVSGTAADVLTSARDTWSQNAPTWLGGATPEPDSFPADATDLVRGPATPVTPTLAASTPEDPNMSQFEPSPPRSALEAYSQGGVQGLARYWFPPTEPDSFPADATDLVRGPATPVTPAQLAVTPEDTNMLEGFSPPSTAQGSPVYYDAFGGKYETQEEATAADRSYGIESPAQQQTELPWYQKLWNAIAGPPIEEQIKNSELAQRWNGVTPEAIDAARQDPRSYYERLATSPSSEAQAPQVYYDAFGGKYETQEEATAADRSYGITGPEGSGQTPVSSVFQYGPETGKYGLDGLVKEIPQANSFEDPQRAQLADAMRRYLAGNPEALKKFSPDAYVMKDGDIGFKKNEGQADMSVFNDPKFAETITKYEKTHLSPVLGGKDGVDNFVKSFGESAQQAPTSAADADRSRTSGANPSGSSDQTPAAPSQTSQTKASPQTAKPLLDQIVSRAGSLVNKLDQGYPLSASDVRANERLQSAALSEVNRQLKANPANMQLQATKTFIAGFSPGDPNSIRRLWRYLQK